MKPRNGFTLVELMIVVFIIALLAALSIPSLLRSRISANEASAIATTRTLSTACAAFFATQTPSQYPLSLAVLATADPPYIENTFATTTLRQGYDFRYLRTGPTSYTLNADPQQPFQLNGTRWFYVDQSGQITVSQRGPAGANSTHLE